MYEKILVAVDHSSAAESVFNSALNLAQLANSQLILLHVLAPDGEDSPLTFAPMSLSYNPETMEQYQKEWEKFEQDCYEQLKLMAQKAQEKGVKTDMIQMQGNPGRTICKLAQEKSVDLIMMGRRGHSTLKEVFVGSVSNYVLHRSHCAVLVVQF